MTKIIVILLFIILQSTFALSNTINILCLPLFPFFSKEEQSEWLKKNRNDTIKYIEEKNNYYYILPKERSRGNYNITLNENTRNVTYFRSGGAEERDVTIYKTDGFFTKDSILFSRVKNVFRDRWEITYIINRNNLIMRYNIKMFGPAAERMGPNLATQGSDFFYHCKLADTKDRKI